MSVAREAGADKKNLLKTGQAALHSLPIITPGVDECWATLDGHRMRYLRAGSGPPLLLIHGLLGYSFSWRFNLAALAQHSTCYAVDLLGVGFSDRPAKIDCSLRASGQRLLRFLDDRGVGPVDVLGTSYGGALAMMLAAEAGSARVRRLILAAPVDPWSDHGRFLARLFASLPGRALLPRIVPSLVWFHELVLRRLYGDVRRIPHGTLAGYSAPIRVPGTVEHILRILRGWGDDLARLEAAVPAIADIPTLLIWGSLDRAVLPTSAVGLQQNFRQAELVMLQGVGHLPYEEAPEEFNHLVVSFLAKNPASR